MCPSNTPIGRAPFAARSERLVVTSFQATSAASWPGRVCTPSTITSWVSTSVSPPNSSTAQSSASPRAAGSLARALRASTKARSFIRQALPHRLGHGIEHAVDELGFARLEEGVGNVDVFADRGADRDVGPGEQLV